MMDRLGVEAQPNATLAAERFERIEESLGYHALPIITDDDRGCSGQTGVDGLKEAGGGASIEVGAGFAIDTHDLLLVRDDAGLDARVPGIGCDQTVATDVGFSQQRLELVRCVVVANGAKQLSL